MSLILESEFELTGKISTIQRTNTTFINYITILFCIKFQNTSSFDNLSIINNNYQEKFIYILAITVNLMVRYLK